MKKISRKLLMTVLTTTLAMISLVTVTFAWFTLTNTATVTDFDVDVKTIGGIEISLGDSYEWFTEVPMSVMQDYLNGLGYGDDFEGLQHITSTDGIDFKDWAGNDLTDGVAGGYIELVINVRSLIEDQEVYLTTNTTLSSDEIEWKADAHFIDSHGNTIVPGTNYAYFVQNSARMSFESVDATIVYELAEGVNGNKYQNTSAQPNGSVSYYERKHNLTDDKKINYSAAVLAPTIFDFTGQDPIVTLSDLDAEGIYYTASITVRIWLEGWDADCIDALLTDKDASKLTASIQFSTDKPV